MRILIVLSVVAVACGAPAMADDVPRRTTMTLADAVARDLVSLEARGGGVQRATLEVTPRADLDLVVPAGTYLRAASGDVQNLVVTKTSTTKLERGKRAQIIVATACASFHRAVPTATHGFQLAAADPALRELVVCLEQRDVDDGRRQQLIWSVTDGVNREQMRQRPDRLRPYLMDACERRLKTSAARCGKLVDLAHDVALDRWLETPSPDDGTACLPAR